MSLNPKVSKNTKTASLHHVFLLRCFMRLYKRGQHCEKYYFITKVGIEIFKGISNEMIATMTVVVHAVLLLDTKRQPSQLLYEDNY